jgi:filamentous hemagglutinin
MKLKDVVSNVVIDPRKLTEYALNPDNPVGTDKALMFRLHLGFTRNNYEELLEQIKINVLSSKSTLHRTDEYGNHYRVDMEIIGIEGQREVVRTGWVVAPDSQEARLTTLYVRRQE